MSDNNLEEHFYCPICNDIFMTPRLYDCGHTICEECMKKIDETDKDKVLSTFDTTIYYCPICRFKSIKSWKYRPINRYLVDIFNKNEKYLELTKNRTLEEPEDLIKKFKNTNFSELSFKNKYIKTEKYYKLLLPVIYDASKEGKSKISILSNTKELQSVSKMLSKKLFRHGIYKIQSTPREFIIHLLPETSGFSSEIINSVYSSNNSTFNSNELNLETEYNNLFSNNLSSISRRYFNNLA